MEYVSKTIEEAGRCANEILTEYGIELNPNWKEINKQWLTEVDRLEKLFGDALGKATQAALNNQAYKYQQAYNEELSKDFGLSFGVLSSSLTAHLLYAAQSAAKERKDHARAERVASEVMQNSHADITAQIFASVYPIYVDSLEPTIQKLLSQYYAYIISIFSKELGCSYDDVIATFNFERSNDFILSKTESVKNNILRALQVDPNNGNVIGYAIRNGILDEELCEYGKNAAPNFGITLKKWAISALSEIHTAGKLFNKPLITDENKGIITGLKTYYKYQCTNLEKCRDWQNIVLSVFTEEASKHLVEWGEISTAIASMLIPEEFDELAKSEKRFYIDNKSKALFVDLYHELNFDGACTSASFLELTPPFSVEDIDNKLNEYNEKLKLRSVELSRQAEQERKEEEARKKAQRQAEIKQQEEKQKQREIMKRKVKKTIIIVSPIVIALVIFLVILNSVIIPNLNYNAAVALLNDGNYEEAISAFEALDGYKDSDDKILECSYNRAISFMDEREYEKAIFAFKKLNGYKDSSKYISDCQSAVQDIAYNNALKLMNTEEYEDAVNEFKKLGDYKDCKALIIEASKIIASQYETAGNTEKAISWYESLGDTEKVKSLKYEYIISHKNRNDTLTYDYLAELKSSNYRDTKSIYSNLYKIKVTIYIENYDLHYIVEGGPPKGEVSIRLLNKSRWYR